MSAQERCLQTAIGSCSGCSVLEVVLDRRRAIPRAEEQMYVEKVQASLCPEGTKMQVPPRREPPLM